MTYVYHRVPLQLKGTTLYPLNELRNIDAQLHREQANKYEGRDWIVESRIEPFDCVWNDVLFFSPADPKDIRWALDKAGVKLRPMQFFKIPAERLDPKKAVILHYRESNKQERQYDPYDPATVSQFSKVTWRTVEDYKEQIARGQNPPLIFPHIFHILYKGTLDIEGIPIVEE